jgi:putative sigma-54 modulation protein
MEATEALREYAIEKVAKVEKYLDQLTEADIVLSKEKHRHTAEVTLNGNRIAINGKEVTGDMYSAIDLVLDKIERQVKKHKGKIQHKDRVRRGRGGPPTGGVSGRHNILSVASGSEGQAPAVVHSERFFVKPMSVEEAIMQMNLRNHEFLVFNNASTDQVNVIYRRRDGDYGLIEPES